MTRIAKKIEAQNDKQPNCWNNHDNAAYYENIPFEIQHGYTILGGLDDYSDLKLIAPYLQNRSSILEVGACFGRVIDYLLENNLGENITAVERSMKYFKLLKQKYNNKVDLIHSDITTATINKKYDAILWMWSGLSDFAKHEQISVLKKLTNLLNPDGVLLIDTFSHAIKPANAQTSHNQSYVISAANCTLYGYIPSPEEMQQYSEQLNINKFIHMPYQTSKSRARSIYILQNTC